MKHSTNHKITDTPGEPTLTDLEISDEIQFGKKLRKLFYWSKRITALVLWVGAFFFTWQILNGFITSFAELENRLDKIFNAQNLNRIGLVFQFIGIFVVVPELIKRDDIARWEKWFHRMGEKGKSIEYSLKDLFLVSPISWLETRGIVGLINLIARSLSFYALMLAITDPNFWSPTVSTLPGKISAIVAIFTWLVMTILDIRYQLLYIKPSPNFRFILSILNFIMLGGWLYLYIPSAILTLVVLNSLRGIAENSIDRILTRATFPFVLFGTLLQLIGSFL